MHLARALRSAPKDSSPNENYGSSHEIEAFSELESVKSIVFHQNLYTPENPSTFFEKSRLGADRSFPTFR